MKIRTAVTEWEIVTEDEDVDLVVAVVPGSDYPVVFAHSQVDRSSGETVVMRAESVDSLIKILRDIKSRLSG